MEEEKKCLPKHRELSGHEGGFDRNHETIMDWLGVDYVPEDVARYTEIQELAKLDAEYVIGEHIISFHNDARIRSSSVSSTRGRRRN